MVQLPDQFTEDETARLKDAEGGLYTEVVIPDRRAFGVDEVERLRLQGLNFRKKVEKPELYLPGLSRFPVSFSQFNCVRPDYPNRFTRP